MNKIVPWGRCRVCKKVFPVTDLSHRAPGKFVGVCNNCQFTTIEPKDNLEDKTKDGIIYFIRAGSSGLIKIGFTTNLEHRLRDLQPGCPDKLVVMATQPAFYGLETKLHTQFYKDHARGEWFFPSKELLKYISELKETE